MVALPIDKITLRPDARSIDAEGVLGLTESIAAVGLINPIRVRVMGDGWEVIAGAHRLAACSNLGLVEIEADVVEDDDLHAELAMIDENLCRAELSPADRARQTARRKAIYEELNPETRQGVSGRNHTVDDRADRFTADTARMTGASERVVQRDAERGEKVIPEVLDLIKGTKLDTGTYLDKLKRMPPNDQVTAAKRDLAFMRAQERDKARKVVRIADAPIDDEDAKERQVAALMSAWNKASAEARQEFLERVDVPVMDRSAA